MCANVNIARLQVLSRATTSRKCAAMIITYSTQLEQQLYAFDVTKDRYVVTLQGDRKMILSFAKVENGISSDLRIEKDESDERLVKRLCHEFYVEHMSLYRHWWHVPLSALPPLRRLLCTLEAKRSMKLLPFIHKQSVISVNPVNKALAEKFVMLEMGAKLNLLTRVGSKTHRTELPLYIRAIKHV